MTCDEFEDLVIETQKEYCLFCNKRPCESDKCTIEKFCSNDNCSGVECGTVFAAFKFGVFDPDKIKEIYKEFDKENWIKSPALLRLLANTMPLWKHEILSSRIKHLLHTVQRKKVESELMLERYVRIFENYLVTCYDQKKYKSAEDACFIKEIIDYILNVNCNNKLNI